MTMADADRIERDAQRRMAESAETVTVTVHMTGTCSNGHPLSDTFHPTIPAGDSTFVAGKIRCACGASGHISGSEVPGTQRPVPPHPAEPPVGTVLETRDDIDRYRIERLPDGWAIQYRNGENEYGARHTSSRVSWRSAWKAWGPPTTGTPFIEVPAGAAPLPPREPDPVPLDLTAPDASGDSLVMPAPAKPYRRRPLAEASRPPCTAGCEHLRLSDRCVRCNPGYSDERQNFWIYSEQKRTGATREEIERRYLAQACTGCGLPGSDHLSGCCPGGEVGTNFTPPSSVEPPRPPLPPKPVLRYRCNCACGACVDNSHCFPCRYRQSEETWEAHVEGRTTVVRPDRSRRPSLDIGNRPSTDPTCEHPMGSTVRQGDDRQGHWRRFDCDDCGFSEVTYDEAPDATPASLDLPPPAQPYRPHTTSSSSGAAMSGSIGDAAAGIRGACDIAGESTGLLGHAIEKLEEAKQRMMAAAEGSAQADVGEAMGLFERAIACCQEARGGVSAAQTSATDVAGRL
jgi:hypothetical protein